MSHNSSKSQWSDSPTVILYHLTVSNPQQLSDRRSDSSDRTAYGTAPDMDTHDPVQNEPGHSRHSFGHIGQHSGHKRTLNRTFTGHSTDITGHYQTGQPDTQGSACGWFWAPLLRPWSRLSAWQQDLPQQGGMGLLCESFLHLRYIWLSWQRERQNASACGTKAQTRAR